MAIGDMLKSFGQGIDRGFTKIGGYDPSQQVSPEEALMRKNAGIEALQRTLGRSSAILSGDPQRLALSAQQDEAARLGKTQQERQKSLQAFAQTNPELAKMYELFGEKGLQQGYLRQQEKQESLAGSQQQMQALQDAGFTGQEINMVLAGLNPKDVIELRTSASFPSGSQMIENVEKNVEKTVKETGVLDTFAGLDQAFGPIDAAQEAASRATRAIFGVDVDPLKSGTGAAVRSKNSLNTEILANLAADFTGRPNMLIYENIKGNLPMSSATSEKDAREKYINIKNQVDARVNNLKQGLESTIISNENKEKYRDELNKSLLLSKKLDAAILSLTGKKEETLKPQDFVSEGKYSNLYTNG